MKTNALSAFIGVYRRLKILLPGLSYHPALTDLRSHRTTTGKDDTDTKMYCLACHLGWGTSVKETDYEKNHISGESAQPLNARSIRGLAKVRVPSWFKVTHEFSDEPLRVGRRKLLPHQNNHAYRVLLSTVFSCVSGTSLHMWTEKSDTLWSANAGTPAACGTLMRKKSASSTASNTKAGRRSSFSVRISMLSN